MVRNPWFDSGAFRRAGASAGLIRTELAALLGVSEQTVKSWEAARRTPTPQRLDNAAALMGVKPTTPKGQGDPDQLDLQGLRKAAGLPVHVAAQRLGIDPKTLRRVEAGKRPPLDPAKMRDVYHVDGDVLANACERSLRRSESER